MNIKKRYTGGTTWELWKSNPYMRFITISTYDLQTTLGRIRWNGDKNMWYPSPWGEAVMDVLEDIHQLQDTVIVEAHSVMPNYVHLLTHFRIQSPQVVHSFVDFCKKAFAREMMRRRPTTQTIWEKAFYFNNVQTRLTQSAYCQALQEHHQTWKYDTLYRPYKDPFDPNPPVEVNHGFRNVFGTPTKGIGNPSRDVEIEPTADDE